MSVGFGTFDEQEGRTLSFEVLVEDPVPAGVTQIANQGVASASNAARVLTDDPETPVVGDPTIDPFGAAALEIPTVSQ